MGPREEQLDDVDAPSSGMLAEHRRELIVALVHRAGSVRVSELTERLGVSDMTIRRDLAALEQSGNVTKVHGGATLPSGAAPTIVEPGFAAKLPTQTDEKRAIAAAATSLIRPGTAIGLTAGTTTWHLARSLADIGDLVVVTNSMRICETVLGFERPDHTVMLTGGVRTPSDALVGPLAEQALAGLHLDQVFMGVHGMTERTGYTTPNLLEATTNKAFVAAAERLVVVADHTKWGTVGLAGIAALADADVVITDASLPDDAHATLDTNGVDVVVAS